VRLEDKSAVITGAARGLGREYALRFAREGAKIAAVDLQEDGAEETAKLVREAGSKAIAIRADVTSEEQMAQAAAAALAEFGSIDVLVNNAALYGDMNIADQSLEYFKKLMDINVLGVIAASRAVFPQMKQQRAGSIINISSSAAYPLPLPVGGDLQTVPVSGYAVSKAAVINLTKSMAKAVGQYKIRVNAIAPGITMTDSTKKLVPDFVLTNLLAATALGTTLEPEHIAGTAVFLASDDSALITGQVLVVDGGLVMVG
jgi:3-oxoacyl-[acyl-carrier protein] reductase